MVQRYFVNEGSPLVAHRRGLVAGVAAWVEGYYLAQYGFEYVAFALLITVILAIGCMRTYWTG